MSVQDNQTMNGTVNGPTPSTRSWSSLIDPKVLAYFSMLLLAMAMYFKVVFLPLLGLTTESREEDADEVDSKCLDESTERFLKTVAVGEKPWFLISSEIYRVVKNSVASIPEGKEVFEKSLDIIGSVSAYIKHCTNSKVVLADPNTCQELITNIDDMLTDIFRAVDDGFDHLRVMLVECLRELLLALRENQRYVALLFANSMESAKDAVMTVKEKVPGPDLMKRTTVYLLKVVQPYVHEGILFCAPYFTRSISPTVQPYFDKAQPYWDSAKNAFLIGPYLSVGETRLMTSVRILKMYCDMSDHIEYRCKYN